MGKFDQYQRSKLHYLCIDVPKIDRKDKLKKLLLAGEDVNAQDLNGWTALHFAAQEGDVEITKLLIDSGADISAIDSNGNTPLWVATINSHYGTEVLEALLSNRADPKQKNIHGVSPIDISPELFNDEM